MKLVRSAVIAGLAGAMTLGLAAPALAVIDPPNQLGCHGTAVISGSNGKSVRFSADDAKVTIPRSGSVAFEGGTVVPLAKSHGELVVHFGFIRIDAGTWNSPNLKLRILVAGVKQLPKALQYAPPGDYQLTGQVTSSAGSCSGHMTLVLAGSPLTNAVGITAVAGTALSALGVGFATRARRRSL